MNGYVGFFDREALERKRPRIAPNTRCRAHESGSGCGSDVDRGERSRSLILTALDRGREIHASRNTARTKWIPILSEGASCGLTSVGPTTGKEAQSAPTRVAPGSSLPGVGGVPAERRGAPAQTSIRETAGEAPGSGIREWSVTLQGLAGGAPCSHRHRNELPRSLIDEVIVVLEWGGQQVCLKAALCGCFVGELRLAPPCRQPTPDLPDKETIELACRTVSRSPYAAIGGILSRQTCTGPAGPRVTTNPICSVGTCGGVPPFEPPVKPLQQKRVGNVEAARLLSVPSMMLLQRVRCGGVEAAHVSRERHKGLASEGMCSSIPAPWNDLHLTFLDQHSTLGSLTRSPHLRIGLDVPLHRVGAYNEASSSEAEERERATTNELSRNPVHPRGGARMGFTRRRTASRGRDRPGSSAREGNSPHRRPKAADRHGGERR